MFDHWVLIQMALRTSIEPKFRQPLLAPALSPCFQGRGGGAIALSTPPPLKNSRPPTAHGTPRVATFANPEASENASGFDFLDHFPLLLSFFQKKSLWGVLGLSWFLSSGFWNSGLFLVPFLGFSLPTLFYGKMIYISPISFVEPTRRSINTIISTRSQYVQG